MKTYLLILLFAIQSCTKHAELEPSSELVDNSSNNQSKFCTKEFNIPCAIPLSLAYTNEYIGKYVELQGVVTIVEQNYVGNDSVGILLFANYEDAKYCNQTSSIYISTKNEQIKAWLTKYRGGTIRVVGILHGTQLPYGRSIQVDELPKYYTRTKESKEVDICGKTPIPPLFPSQSPASND